MGLYKRMGSGHRQIYNLDLLFIKGSLGKRGDHARLLGPL